MTRTLAVASLLAFAAGAAAQTPAPAGYVPVPPPPPAAPAPAAAPGPAAVAPAPAPAAAPVAVAPAPAPVAVAQPAPPPLDPKLRTWFALGGAWGFSESYVAGTFGGARLLKANVGPTFELQYAAGGTTAYSPWLLPVRVGLAWFAPSANARITPYFGAHYVLLNGDTFEWDSGAGARLGFSMAFGELRLDAKRVVQQRLTVFVTYDRAFNCQKGCDLFAPQVGLIF